MSEPGGAPLPTRLVITTGTGGSGVTTLAATTAVLGANRGLRTLLFTPSDGLGLPAVLDHAVGEDEPTRVDTNLYAQRFAAQRAFATAYQNGAAGLRTLLDAIGIVAPDPTELVAPPGMFDVLLLQELVDITNAGIWDLVVVDAPPLPAALRLLALPDAADAWLRRLRPAENQAARALRPVLAGLAGLPSPQQGIVRAADWTQRRLDAAREMLTGPASSVRLVTTPGSVRLAALRHALSVLTLHGVRLDGVLVNRVLAANDVLDPAPEQAAPNSTALNQTWHTGWAATQQGVIEEITELFDPVAIHTVPFRGAEPIGLEELSVLATATYGTASAEHDPFAPPAEPPRPELIETDRGYVYVIPLPLSERSGLDVVRRGDELTVTVGTFRRSFVLPGVLRRSTVTGATMRERTLRVKFVPDPEQWPTGRGDAQAHDAARDGARPSRARGSEDAS
jgi:arsenite-transporting ATPase